MISPQHLTFRYSRWRANNKTLVNLILYYKLWDMWSLDNDEEFVTAEKYIADDVDPGKYDSKDILHK